MAQSIVQRRIEDATEKIAGETAIKLFKQIEALAAKQGGTNAIENYQLLGKRALIVVGVGFAVVQTAVWITTTFISRKREEQRIEQTVRRILAEQQD